MTESKKNEATFSLKNHSLLREKIQANTLEYFIKIQMFLCMRGCVFLDVYLKRQQILIIFYLFIYLFFAFGKITKKANIFKFSMKILVY